MQLDPGVYPAFPNGATDATHFQQYGAIKMAELVARLIKQSPQLTTLSALVPDIPIPDSVPSVPANLTVLTVGSASVKFKWDAVSGADLYDVYRAVIPSGSTADDVSYTLIGTNVVGQYTDSTCQAGVSYAYKVSSYNEKGESAQSSTLTVTTKASLYKCDFAGTGTNVGPTLDGWNKVTANQMYTAQAGYGFLTAPNNGRYRSGTTYDSMQSEFSLGAGTFAADLPNGDYSIKVYCGDVMTGTSSTKTTFSAEGTALGTVTSPKAGIGTAVYNVRILDGQLTLDVNGYLAGLEITPISLAPTGLNSYEVDLTQSNSLGYFSLRFNPTQDAASYRIYHKSSASAFSVFDSFDAGNAGDLHSYSETRGDTYQYYVVGVLADGTETAPSNTVTIDMPAATDRTSAQSCPIDADQATVNSAANALTSAIGALVKATLVRQPMETLTDRALVAVAITDGNNTFAGAKSGVYLSWRLFKEDPTSITFDVYRNGVQVKVGLAVTNWTDTDGKAGDTYYVIASSGVGSDAAKPDKVTAWADQYKELQLVKPADEVMPDGSTCTYTANDMSVGDLDGKYELIVKWYPSNAKDNSQGGYTGKTFLDAYDFDGKANTTQDVNGTVEGYDSPVTATLDIVYPAVYKFDFGISSSQVTAGYTGNYREPQRRHQ